MKFRMDFGYQESDRPGVWRSNNIMDSLFLCKRTGETQKGW
jgi:hypothetical protein